MEVDTIGGDEGDDLVIKKLETTTNFINSTGDEKRTKWQHPPSHHNLFSTPAARKLKGDKMIDSEDTDDISDKISFENIASSLSLPKTTRLNNVARAEVCPKKHRARLMSTKGMAARIRDHYGYEISNTTFLYAEEALYLLEIGKLEIYLGRISLSVERARALFLHSKMHPGDNNSQSKVRSCSADEYLVYKHLSQLGYRVRRRDQNDIKIGCFPNTSNSLIPDEPTLPDSTTTTAAGINIYDADEGCKMDLDVEEEIVMQIPEEELVAPNDLPSNGIPLPQSTTSSSSSGIGNSAIGCTRGIKRKFIEVCNSQSPGSSTPSSSAKDVSDDEDADGELECASAGGVSGDVNMDNPSSATSASETAYFPQSSNYTVIEADSDVEIIDESCEMIGNGVQIEEIGFGYDGDVEDDPAAAVSQEPQPSTSAACFSSQGLVDLAESDSEDEDWKSFGKVWNKFVPNATIQIGIPPPSLLPNNIPQRGNIYEFDLQSRESNRADSDLEYFVDELSLNSSPKEGSDRENRKSDKNESNYRSWGEWRQGTMNEAKDVLNESLMASQPCNTCPGDDPLKKLHLWGHGEPDTKRKAEEGWRNLNMPFELYHPTAGYNKHKSRDDIQPNYIITVVRSDAPIPSFSSCDPLINGVPVLIAIVNDDTNILFINPDRSPVPSLY